MTQQETILKLQEISRQLMLLANNNNGNQKELDAILKADIELQKVLK